MDGEVDQMAKISNCIAEAGPMGSHFGKSVSQFPHFLICKPERKSLQSRCYSVCKMSKYWTLGRCRAHSKRSH